MFGLLMDSIYEKHETGQHPEQPRRLVAIREGIEGSQDLRYEKIEPVRAPIEALTLVHDPDYVSWVAQQIELGYPQLDHDTAVCPESYDIALKAVGGALSGIDAIIEGKLKRAFFFVRPPGHHAEKARAMGFCLFNNIAVSAAWLIKHHHLQRVAIYDWDVHHGNGTMHSFYTDPSVFYGSVHQWPLFPGTGSAEETGWGPGVGTTLNMPLPTGAGDDDYEVAANRFADAMDKFKPDFLLISAGFDAHWADPLAGHQVTEKGFEKMAKVIDQISRTHCNGRIALFLEGGYNLAALKNCVPAVVRVLQKDL